MTNKTDRKIAVAVVAASDVLRQYQKQIDMEGIEVGVSRQALDEVLEQLAVYEQRVAELEDALHKVIEDSELGIVPRSHLDKIKDLLK